MAEQPPVYDAGFLPNGKPKDRKLSRAERHRQAVDLRRAGATYQQIGAALGYATKSGAFKAVQTALRHHEHDSVAELRQLQGDRLDTALRAVWPRVLLGDDGAIRSMLGIEKRRAALFGLDAPTRTELTGRDGGPLLIDPAPVYDYSQLTEAELDQLTDLAERISRDEGSH